MIEFGPARSDEDLRAILDLQHRNLPAALSPSEAAREGYVTLKHTLDLLRRMNTPHAHSVARDAGRVIAYALVMLPEIAPHIPALAPMFERLDRLRVAERPLAETEYVVMGQVCVDKPHRGRGVFAGLYAEMAARLAPHFASIITEIDAANPRSLRAHQKVGFLPICEYASDAVDWVIVHLPLQPDRAR